MLRTPQQPQTLWRTPKGYAATHCMQCEAGWTRTDAGGAVITVCLLDREPVLADMTDCDRFLRKVAPEAT